MIGALSWPNCRWCRKPQSHNRNKIDMAINYFLFCQKFCFGHWRFFSQTALARMVTFLVFMGTTTVSSAFAKPAEEFPEGAKFISIGGALTEIVYALGAEKQLIARDTTSNYPIDAQKLPDVGYMRNLSPEGILSLGPEAILLDQSSGPASTIEILENAAVPMVEVSEHFTHEGIREKILKIGHVLHKEPEAQALIKKVDDEFAENDALLRKFTKPKRILFALTVQNGRIMAAGKNTAADGIIKLSGATNAVDGYNGYKLLTDEAIIKAAPDLILMMGHAGISATPDDIYQIPAIQTTPAYHNKAVKQMDGLYILGFGPRTPLAVREVIAALYKDE